MTDDGNKGKILRFTQEPDFYAKRGDVRRAQHDLLAAISMYNEALAKDPHDLDTRLAAAEVLTDMSRFNDSNRMLIPYMHEDEDFEKDAWCMAGFNLLAMNELDGAEGCFDRFFSMTDEVSERTDAILNALDYIDDQRTEKPFLTDAASADRERRALQGQKAFDSQQFGRAADIWCALAEEDPDDSRMLYDSALALICNSEPEKGGAYIDRLLEKEPRNIHALSLALLLAKGGKDFSRMEELCARIEEAETDDLEELIRINGVLMESGRTELAAQFIQRALKIAPYEPLINHRYALCLIERGLFGKAADVYDKLVRIDRNDLVARYFRGICSEAEKSGEKPFASHWIPALLTYQIPPAECMERIKEIFSGRMTGINNESERFQRDESYRDKVRWAFSVYEPNITRSLLAVLSEAGGEEAEHLVRECLADINTPPGVINDAMGALKRMGADEPYFAVSDGRLIQGKVNIIDFSGIRIPKAYRDIFERIKQNAAGRCSDEVMRAAAEVTERFIASTGGVFPPLTRQKSEALSAAIEFIACERCEVMTRDDLLSSYGVTERRLMNAMELIVRTLGSDAGEFMGDGEDDE